MGIVLREMDVRDYKRENKGQPQQDDAGEHFRWDHNYAKLECAV